MAHDHHDHSNCNHDHGHDHGSDANKMTAASEEIANRQQAADKLAKSLVLLQELANDHKKKVQVKTPATPVNKADVELLMKELQLTKPEAEAALRKNNNDVVTALTSLVAH